jgi:hypothetical protein
VIYDVKSILPIEAVDGRLWKNRPFCQVV